MKPEAEAGNGRGPGAGENARRSAARAADERKRHSEEGAEDAGFAYGRGWSRLSDDDERVVHRYYPIFENLILFVLNSGRWVRNFRGFIGAETRYRGRLVVRGFLLFTVALALVFGGGLMLVFGFFFLFRDLTGSAWQAAFLNVLVMLALAAALFLSFLGAMRKIGTFSRHQDGEGDPGFRRRRAARRQKEADT